MDFVPVAKLSALADPGRLAFELSDHLLVLLRVGGDVFCLEDMCTHDGGPLSDGEQEDHTLACPRHGAKFDIRTGRALTMPATQATLTHEIRIDGDDVLVRLRDE